MELIAHPQMIWNQLEPEFQHLVAEVAQRLNINSVHLTSHLYFCLQTMRNDISQSLLDIPENHFKKQLLPEAKHCWVSSEGVRLQVRGKELIIGKVSNNINRCIRLEKYIYAIQAYRTRIRQITTYNTIVPFAVIDYCLSPECPSMISHHLSYKELNFRLPDDCFEVLRKEGRNTVKEYILCDKERKIQFYEFCGQYIPSITYKERISKLYPYIVKALMLRPGEKVKVFDIGCAPKVGYGAPSLINFVAYLTSNGYQSDCQGIDIEFPKGFVKWNDEYKGNKIRYYHHDIRSTLPVNERYDVVFCCNVVEWYDSKPETKKDILRNLVLLLNMNGLLIMDEAGYYFIYQKKDNELKCLLKRERALVEAC
jgi:2-polyprenyl-3-methyl-5-hydroxy-6-metoxy-1,4-benzoquinol methylase